MLIAVCAPAPHCPARGGERSRLDEVLELAGSSRRKARVGALATLRRLALPGTPDGDRAAFAYAELCLRFHSEGQAGALKEARRAFAELAEKSRGRWGLRGKIGLWRADAAAGRVREAAGELVRFIARGTRCERACEAAWYLGCLYCDDPDSLERLGMAADALGHALELHRAVAAYNPPVVSEKEIREKLAWVRRRLREIAAGEARVLFERAEKLRERKRFDAAINIYAEIVRKYPGAELGQLSRLRLAQCRFGKGQVAAALELARAFVAEDPLGPYRGHAHLFVGDVWLEHFFDVGRSEPEFRCVLERGGRPPDWVAALRASLSAGRARAGAGAGAEDAKDPEDAPAPPADRAGETWDRVTAAAHERAGIFAYLRRNFEEAAAHFAVSQRLAPVGGYWANDPSVGMAEVAEMCRKRKMPLDESLLAQGDERTRLVLFLGAVYMHGWKDRRGIALFERVWKGEFRGATPDQRAFARARIGAGWHHLFEYPRAEAIYREFEKPPLSRSIYAGDALLQRAAVVSKMGRPYEAMPLFERVMREYPGTWWADQASYQRAFFSYCLENPRVGLRWCRRALRDHPNSIWVRRCRQWIGILEEKAARGEPGMCEKLGIDWEQRGPWW
jgi:tetratricopeptide (TPR) repeat protein